MENLSLDFLRLCAAELLASCDDADLLDLICKLLADA